MEANEMLATHTAGHSPLQNPVSRHKSYKLKQLCAKAVSKNITIARHKVLLMLQLQLQNFQTAIITSRRRSQQRIRRRQAQLRTFFMQQLMALETSFIEIVPVLGSLSVQYANEFENQERDTSKEIIPVQHKKSRPTLSFHEYALKNFNDVQWMTTFRVSKKTFHWLCRQLHAYFKSNVAKRVALALYTLGNGDNYRSIETLFGVPRLIVLKLLKRFGDALLARLGKYLIAMPKEADEFNEIREGFRNISNMPGLVVGVLGVCEFKQENDGGKVLLHTVIDDKLLFRKLQLPKSQKSTLQVPNEINKLPAQQINGRKMACFLVTSVGAHPLHTWLMKRFIEPAAPHEYDFNEAIENLLVIKEKAFLRLYARWKILSHQRRKPIPQPLYELIVITCCALHNLLEENEEEYLENWEENVNVTAFQCSHIKDGAIATSDDEAALEMREYLAKTISSTEM